MVPQCKSEIITHRGVAPATAAQLCLSGAAGRPLGAASRQLEASPEPVQLLIGAETGRACHCGWLRASHPLAAGASLQQKLQRLYDDYAGVVPASAVCKQAD